ncbi:MFS transporter [Enterovirga sp. GCM10030262]|uniref:MFS transporter n=1 Tax=Enterovirga sp. GCM10030262 TaxID=3273391 RepID=UPI003615F7E5
MSGYSLPKERFALLFAIMLVAASGNTAMQSLMPSIGRELGIPDLWVAIAFSLSAVVWVLTAPHWARMSDRRGRRALMRLGLYGFIVSMLICGAVLAAGLAGLLAPMTVFIIFVLGRAVYGGWGSASPPAVQAYVAARTEGEQRTNALSAIASSFGLGTIIGPALAPLFIVEPLGLSGPLIVFALIGAAVLAAVITRLPDDTPKSAARGQIVGEPSIGGANNGASLIGDDRPPAPLRWRDPRVFAWHMIGAIGGHGHAALLGVIGFLVIDRLALPLDDAQQSIALVLMAGAGATLLAQWGLIPRLALDPRALVLWGSLLSAAGAVVTGLADGIYGITTGFALASLGFGFFRPGFTSGASLAVAPDEQNAVAGMVTSVNGVAFIAAPALGVGLYGLSMPLPFLVTAALMLGLALWVSLRFRPSTPAA